MGINLRGFDVGVAEPFADFIDGNALLCETGGEGVPEFMPAKALRLLVCSLI